ncbi:MAG: thrombospondin type 3 repeat-containing protein [Chloroflexi bacterium]|nr:thrombospondin type 3 repeat-containing protein [Chloroflexota bacterium]
MKLRLLVLGAILAVVLVVSVPWWSTLGRGPAVAKDVITSEEVALAPDIGLASAGVAPTVATGDGLADLIIPADLDGDGIPNEQDNCPLIPNPSMVAGQPQPDHNNNGTGDACDWGDQVNFPTNMRNFIQQQRQIISAGRDGGDPDGVINAMDNVVSMANAIADRGLGQALLSDMATAKTSTNPQIAAAANGFESILLINLEGAGPNFTINPLVRNATLQTPSLPGVPQEAAFTAVIPYLGCHSIVKETKGLVWIPWPGSPALQALGIKYWDIFAPAEFVKKISICRETRGVAPAQYVRMEVIIEGLLFRFRAFWPKADP